MYANRRNFLLLLVNISSISSQVLILKWIFAHFASPLLWVLFLIVHTLEKPAKRAKNICPFGTNVFYTSLFQSFWSSEVIMSVLYLRKQTFLWNHYYTHSTCCPRLYSDTSEHEPRWLARHVTQLRQNKSTLICIFLESSKVVLSNGYLTLKIW